MLFALLPHGVIAAAFVLLLAILMMAWWRERREWDGFSRGWHMKRYPRVGSRRHPMVLQMSRASFGAPLFLIIDSPLSIRGLAFFLTWPRPRD